MSNELQKKEDDSNMIAVLENSLYPGASPQSINLVMEYCRLAKLDAMQKPVHIVPMWDSKSGRMRDVVMPGIGLYRTQAARSGNYAGMTEPEFGEDVTETIGGQQITYPKWCRVTVKRLSNGVVCEFTAKEFWKENYAVKGGKEKSIAPNAMWTKRPYAQIAKCAEAQALRKAFPEIGSQPTDVEMEGKEIEYSDGNTIDGHTGEIITKQPALPAYTDEQFEKNLSKWADMMAAGRINADEIIAKVSSKAKMTEEQIATVRSFDMVVEVGAA